MRQLGVINALSQDGSTVIIKVDGEREKNLYTVLMFGGRLEEETLGGDGSHLTDMLEKVCEHYTEKVPMRAVK